MSLRCGNCTSAFFSQKLLDQHRKKCSGSNKTRFTVSVRLPDEEVAEKEARAAAQSQKSQQQQLLLPESPPTPPQAQPQAVKLRIVDTENVSPGGGSVSVGVISGGPHRQPQHHGRLLRADIPLRMPTDRRRVACNACGKLFSGLRCCNWLADHLRIEHLDQPPHSCPHCGALFVYFDTLQEHVAANHSSEGADDAAADAAATSVSDDKQLLPAEGYAYSCGLCNETYADLPLLLKHFADLHPEFASPDELVAAATAPLLQQQHQILFACTLCSQSFDQLMSGQLHLQRNHPNEWRQIVCCPVCQLNCKTESLNQAHIRSTHANPKTLPEGQATCRLCARLGVLSGKSGSLAHDVAVFSGADQLFDHYVSVHFKPMSAYIVETTAAAVAAGGDTLYECGGCKARYKDRMLLEAHFQAGCPSLTAPSSEAQLTDAVDDAAYLQSGAMTA